MSAKLYMANLVAIVILAFALTNVQGEYNVAKYCALVAKNTKLPSFESCETYYICVGSNDVTKHSCPKDQVFNKDKGDCVDKSQSNCKIGLSNPCAGKNNEFATDFQHCNMWHWCVDGKSNGKGTCRTGQHFDGEKCANGKCIDENIGQNYGNLTEVNDLCNIMKIGMFFGDFNDCDIWYKCFADKPMKMGKCSTQSDGHVLNLDLQGCSPYSKAICERTGGEAPVQPGETCKKDAKRPDEQRCSKYYLCKDSKWTQASCDNNKYFDVNEGECKDRLKAQTVKTCDRCEYSNNKWVNAVDSKCTKYLTCKDGKKVSEGSCGDKAYFDEERQVCIAGINGESEHFVGNPACVCDLECELDKCKGKDENEEKQCKENVCEKENGNKKADCKFVICKNATCKKQACDGYDDIHKKINCNLKACEDDTCKTKYCNDEAADKTYCELQLCTNQKCREQVCKSLENDIDKKVDCNIRICTDDTCKFKACDAKTNPTENWKCKHEICKDLSAEVDQFKCKIKYCPSVKEDNDDDVKDCKTAACDSYTNNNEKAECLKANTCETDVDNCKIDICTNTFGNPEELTDKVKCKLNDCGTKACKDKICNANDNTIEEKIECKIQVCNDKTCRDDACDEHTSDDDIINCKLNNCKNDEKCKNDVCKDKETVGNCSQNS